MENYTNSEMTDVVLCYGSVALRAQALYREKFPAHRVSHSGNCTTCRSFIFKPLKCF
jgi:hypothetical protein